MKRQAPAAELQMLLDEVECHVPLHVVEGWPPTWKTEARAWAEAVVFNEPGRAVRPEFLKHWDSRRCRACGCTQNRACPEGCSWTEPDLCSACAPGDRP